MSAAPQPMPRPITEIKAAVLRGDPISDAEEYELSHQNEAFYAKVADAEERAGLKGELPCSACGALECRNCPGRRPFMSLEEGAYRMTIPDAGIELLVDRLRRKSDELVGQLSVRCRLPGALTVGDDLLSVSDFNLSSQRARQDRARYLESRAQAKLDWTGIVEEFSQQVIRAERKGQPALLLRDVPRPKPDDVHLVDGLPLLARHPMTALGNLANRFQAVRDAADAATKTVAELLAKVGLFESQGNPAALEGIAEFSKAMGASNEQAIRKQVESLKAQGVAVDEIAKFYKGRLSPALAESLGLTEKQVKAWETGNKAAEKAREEFQRLVDSLSGGTAQAEVDQLARAFDVLGVEGVADLEALRKKLEQLEKQGAKITGGLLGVLRGGKVAIPDALPANLDLGEALPEMGAELSASLKPAQESFNAIAQSAAAAGMEIEEIEAHLRSAGAEGVALYTALAKIPEAGIGEAFKSGFSAGLKGLPQVILGALQGGGDVGKSIGAHLGGSIGTEMAKPLTDKLTGALGKTLGEAFGSLAGPLGSVLGSGIGSILTKGIGKLAGAFGIGGNKVIMQVNDMRDAFFEAQGGFVALQQKLQGLTNQDLVKKIFDAKTVDQFNAAVSEVMGLLGSQEQAQQALKEATDRYGFTLAELGPTMQRQELDAQAAQLLKDFKLLTASGIDVNTVMSKMGPDLAEFVKQSIAAGQAIPEAMRPMVEQLIASGQLLDENGRAFGSAEEAGITFTETLTEGLSRAVDAIELLVAALTGVPPVRIPVTYDVQNNIPGVPSSGEVPVPGDVPGFAGGTGFRMVDFGEETLVKLHGPEMVLTKDDVGKLSGMGGGQASTTYNIQTHISPFQTAEVVEQYADYVSDRITDRIFSSAAARIARE